MLPVYYNVGKNRTKGISYSIDESKEIELGDRALLIYDLPYHWSVTQRNKVSALGLTAKADMIVISEEIGTEKPEEANYHRIMDKFADPRYCYLADNLRKDFKAPNKLGRTTVGLIDRAGTCTLTLIDILNE